MDFKYKDYDRKDKKVIKDYNWENLYEHNHSELSLQQTKRDQIISLYIALFSFMIPFAVSIDNLTWRYKGLLFIVLGVIGLLLAPIIVRYRTYKEIYWLSCQTITQLINYDKNEVDKALVQSLFYSVLKKKSKGLVKFKKNGKVSNLHFMKKQLFSSETLYYIIHSGLASVITSLGLFFLFDNLIISLCVSLSCFTILAIILMTSYFKNIKKVYQVAIDGKDSSFNFAFSRAWFLHFYID